MGVNLFGGTAEEDICSQVGLDDDAIVKMKNQGPIQGY